MGSFETVVAWLMTILPLVWYSWHWWRAWKAGQKYMELNVFHIAIAVMCFAAGWIARHLAT